MNTAEQDQARAAVNHTAAIMTAAFQRAGKPYTHAPGTELKHRMILAALEPCEPCWHLVDTGPQPVYALLETQHVVCANCLPDGPGEQPDTCAWCGDNPAEITLVAQYGNAVLIGAACGECDRIITK